MHPSQQFMEVAIEQAKRAGKDYPIGAVIVKDEKIIAESKTDAKASRDPTNHAEVAVIRQACRSLGSMYLEGAVLYTTLEPCAMCAAAAVWAKMEHIVFGATMEDAIEHSKTLAGDHALSYRQIHLKCRDVLKKSEISVALDEAFMREECIALFR